MPAFPYQARYRYVDALEENPLRLYGAPVIFVTVQYAEGLQLLPGTVLGLVTETSSAAYNQVQPCVKTATDGSQVPYAITVEPIDTTANGPAGVAGPQTAAAYAGGYFNVDALIFDTSWGATPDAAYAAMDTQLRQIGIYARNRVFSS